MSKDLLGKPCHFASYGEPDKPCSGTFRTTMYMNTVQCNYGHLSGRFSDKPSAVTCETCGKLTDFYMTKRCDPCWEVERRLRDYLKLPNGQATVLKALEKATGSSFLQLTIKDQARLLDQLEHVYGLSENDEIRNWCIRMTKAVQEL